MAVRRVENYEVEESWVELPTAGLEDRVADLRAAGLSSRSIVSWLARDPQPVDPDTLAHEHAMICLRCS